MNELHDESELGYNRMLRHYQMCFREDMVHIHVKSDM